MDDSKKLSDLESIIRSCLLMDEDISFCNKLLLMLTMSSGNPGWIEDLCIEIIMSQRPDDLRGLAVTCLGHLARIHGKIDHAKVIAALTPLRDNPVLSGRIEDAMSDIEMFAPSNSGL